MVLSSDVVYHQWLLQKVQRQQRLTGQAGCTAASLIGASSAMSQQRCAGASACASAGSGNPVAASETSAGSPTAHEPLAHQV